MQPVFDGSRRVSGADVVHFPRPEDGVLLAAGRQFGQTVAHARNDVVGHGLVAGVGQAAFRKKHDAFNGAAFLFQIASKADFHRFRSKKDNMPILYSLIYNNTRENY